MTPEEKAKELFEKFERIIINSNADSWTDEAKQCVIICVYEILATHMWPAKLEYWNKVKEAIYNQISNQ